MPRNPGRLLTFDREVREPVRYLTEGSSRFLRFLAVGNRLLLFHEHDGSGFGPRQFVEETADIGVFRRAGDLIPNLERLFHHNFRAALRPLRIQLAVGTRDL